jgi:PIN domain nuclease of toxin-antitoxin system
MRYLLDTHLLLWAVTDDVQLSSKARQLMMDSHAELYFSVVSLWEIAIKGEERIGVSAERLRETLLDAGYLELTIEARDVMGVAALPPVHRDPFDRLLVATVHGREGFTLLSHDQSVAQYPGPILAV